MPKNKTTKTRRKLSPQPKKRQKTISSKQSGPLLTSAKILATTQERTPMKPLQEVSRFDDSSPPKNLRAAEAVAPASTPRMSPSSSFAAPRNQLTRAPGEDPLALSPTEWDCLNILRVNISGLDYNTILDWLGREKDLREKCRASLQTAGSKQGEVLSQWTTPKKFPDLKPALTPHQWIILEVVYHHDPELCERLREILGRDESRRHLEGKRQVQVSYLTPMEASKQIKPTASSDDSEHKSPEPT